MNNKWYDHYKEKQENELRRKYKKGLGSINTVGIVLLEMDPLKRAERLNNIKNTDLRLYRDYVLDKVFYYIEDIKSLNSSLAAAKKRDPDYYNKIDLISRNMERELKSYHTITTALQDK